MGKGHTEAGAPPFALVRSWLQSKTLPVRFKSLLVQFFDLNKNTNQRNNIAQ